ncbi:ABC transporter permease [Desertibacillus haloalkaliphilus]|uniref:ABC transporter permease n=1 Tax=Desertibacillus haloalkaliphilus TaxID=1328930 RepID=UPI001C27EE15|nr:proline/glycine betaine ABC transporter permease [Desertibacillus haloalkaliphilus]MBU8906796.1 proline/glycine betaine ABC transporter permease [Desertibacillus haloalkaliphilus]
MNYFDLPLEQWTNTFVNEWLIPVLGGFFDVISAIIGFFIGGVESILTWVPAEVITVILILLAWKFASRGIAIFTLFGCLYLGSVNLWADAMQTLAIVLVATIFSILVGIPLGILSAKYKKVDQLLRPVLDFMQTLPSFVYLIPAILLFGLGGVPAVISTFVFATPPAVRMTTLGIKQVSEELIEASHAFGATSKQMLLKVQLPLAVPTIMAGVNQTIMLALSMAVIASMIGAPGLGSTVLAGISSVNVGLGLTGGLGIVVLAIILDRITQGVGQKA